ncbi:hypothetical protein ABZ725_14730 [Streptomyces sp. NPDC006872]|uniref:hypothetical protein n=1 Tax=Streptomyces sp. NPDC006872 TaxID=3155720 RepID=UPI0033D69F84
MSHRPYPNRERALRQLGRHVDPAPTIPAPTALLQFGESMARMREGARRVLAAQFPVDQYQLSTRPGVVGGEA